MITMNRESVTWVGNIYQKFEAMCLEVEEIMYEDTVKYVENQVQTVGASMKRFYSDVMQDFLPPHTEDSAKGAVSDFPVELYDDVRMKPGLDVKEMLVKVDDTEHFNDDPKLTRYNDSNQPCTLHALLHVDNLYPLSQGGSTGGECKRHNNASLLKNSKLDKISKRDNLSLNGTSVVITSFNKDLARASSLCEITSLDKDLIRASSVCNSSKEISESSLNQKAIITTPECFEIKNETKNVSEQLPDVLANEASSIMVTLADTGESKKMDIGLSSSSRTPAESIDVSVNNSVVSPVESSANGNVESCLFDNDVDFVSNSGRSADCNTNVEDDSSIEQDTEIIHQVDKINLDEGCIMVNGDEFHLDPCIEGKSRPYKKKIRDVFSSRKNSVRKQEYEQLAVLYCGDSKSKQVETQKSSMPTVSVTKRSSTSDFCESEWELL